MRLIAFPPLPRPLGGFLTLLLMVSAGAVSPVAADEIGVRIGAGTGTGGGFNSQEIYWRPAALAPRLGDPRRWHVTAYTEFNAGRVSRSDDTMYTGGAGVGGWLIHPRWPVSFGIGTGPTYISQRSLGGREFGSHWQFTSHAAVRLRLADQLSVGYRIQHTSNGGLASPNDGYDIQALEIRLSF